MIVVFGVLAAVFVALVIRKFVRATPRARRILRPLLLAAVVAALRACYEFLLTFVSAGPSLTSDSDDLFWWQVIGLIALPLALLGGSCSRGSPRPRRRPRARARAACRRRAPRRARAARSTTRRSSSGSGCPSATTTSTRTGSVALPEDGRRAVRSRDRARGEPLAALVHDPALLRRARARRGGRRGARARARERAPARRAARPARRACRSRARGIVAAGDEERRRIERDLHDGAQQRLVALALELRAAQRRLGGRRRSRAASACSPTRVDELAGRGRASCASSRAASIPAILTERGPRAPRSRRSPRGRRCRSSSTRRRERLPAARSRRPPTSSPARR